MSWKKKLKEGKKVLNPFQKLEIVDIWAHVLQFIDLNETIEMRRTCKVFLKAFEHPVSVNTLKTSRNFPSFIFLFSNFLYYKTDNIQKLRLEFLSFLWIAKIAKTSFKSLKNLTILRNREDFNIKDLLDCRDIELDKLFPKLEVLKIPLTSKEVISINYRARGWHYNFGRENQGFYNLHLLFKPSSYLNLVKYHGSLSVLVLNSLSKKLKSLFVTCFLGFTLCLNNQKEIQKLEIENGVSEYNAVREVVDKLSKDILLGKLGTFPLESFSFGEITSKLLEDGKYLTALPKTLLKSVKVMNFSSSTKQQLDSFQYLNQLYVDWFANRDNQLGETGFESFAIPYDLDKLNFNQPCRELKLCGRVKGLVVNGVTYLGFGHPRVDLTKFRFDKGKFVRKVEVKTPTMSFHEFSQLQKLPCLEILSVDDISFLSKGDLKDKDVGCKFSSQSLRDLKFLISKSWKCVHSQRIKMSFICPNLKKVEAFLCGGSELTLHCASLEILIAKINAGRRSFRMGNSEMISLTLNCSRVKECMFEGECPKLECISPTSCLEYLSLTSSQWVGLHKELDTRNVKTVRVTQPSANPESHVKLEDLFSSLQKYRKLESVYLDGPLLKGKRIKKSVSKKWKQIPVKSLKINFGSDDKSSFCYSLLCSVFEKLEVLEVSKLLSFGKADLKCFCKKGTLKNIQTMNLKISTKCLRLLPTGAVFSLMSKYTKQCIHFSLVYESYVDEMVFDIDLSKTPQLLSLCLDNEVNFSGDSKNLKYLSLCCQKFDPEKSLSGIENLLVLEIRKSREFKVMDEKFIGRILRRVSTHVLAFRKGERKGFFWYKDFRNHHKYRQYMQHRKSSDKYSFSRIDEIQKKFETTCLIFAL